MNFNIIDEIPLKFRISKVKPILKGWSNDQKFYIEDINGQKFIIKICDASKYTNKQREYEGVNACQKTNIPISKIIDFGLCKKRDKVYSIFTWIDGEDCEKRLPNLSTKKQYDLGIKSGQILKKIHTAPGIQIKREFIYDSQIKIKKKILKYKNCGVTVKNDEKIIKFIESNLKYLTERPQVFRHGDFHVGNFILNNDDELYVIDFNRSDFGDPYEEFDRAVFTWKTSVPFMIGQIHGYFNNNVPDSFFKLMSIYNFSNALGAIPWAIPCGEKEVSLMIDNLKCVMDWYKDFKLDIPYWYLSPKCASELYLNYKC